MPIRAWWHQCSGCVGGMETATYAHGCQPPGSVDPYQVAAARAQGDIQPLHHLKRDCFLPCLPRSKSGAHPEYAVRSPLRHHEVDRVAAISQEVWVHEG